MSQAAPWRRRCASTVTDASLRYLIRVWTDHYGPVHAARAFYLPPEVAAEWLTSRSNESNSSPERKSEVQDSKQRLGDPLGDSQNRNQRRNEYVQSTMFGRRSWFNTTLFL